MPDSSRQRVQLATIALLMEDLGELAALPRRLPRRVGGTEDDAVAERKLCERMRSAKGIGWLSAANLAELHSLQEVEVRAGSDGVMAEIWATAECLVENIA